MAPSFIATSLLAGLLLALAGCMGPPKVIPAPAIMPSYAELAQRYNRNLTGLKSLWARNDIILRWREEGKSHSETGEGTLQMLLPSRVALTMGKVGNTMLWVGCDDQRYWLFDMTGDKPVAYVGRHENVGKPGTKVLPLPVQPRDLPRVLGLIPLETAVVTPAPTVKWLSTGRYQIEPPGTKMRLAIDPKTALPVTVELLDDRGQTVLSTELSAYQRVPTQAIPKPDWPSIATQATITLSDDHGTSRLKLIAAEDGSEEGGGSRIKDAAFDFDRLVKAHRPVEIVDLDKPE